MGLWELIYFSVTQTNKNSTFLKPTPCCNGVGM
jgi:hypothetical protein